MWGYKWGRINVISLVCVLPLFIYNPQSITISARALRNDTFVRLAVPHQTGGG